MAWRVNPTWVGSVTATTCMISESSSFWTRARAAASDSPTAFAIAA